MFLSNLGCIIDDLQQTSDVLWKLKSLGVSIAIDDFGSGYASFSYLSKLPVDVLKLDKILIDDLGINSDISDMLQSIIELCRRMNIKVVAEGVEDEQQVEMLRKLGCHYIQGYVYSKPVTKTHFEKILINQFSLNCILKKVQFPYNSSRVGALAFGLFYRYAAYR